jgi:hypothetical protein
MSPPRIGLFLYEAAEVEVASKRDWGVGAGEERRYGGGRPRSPRGQIQSPQGNEPVHTDEGSFSRNCWEHYFYDINYVIDWLPYIKLGVIVCEPFFC